MVERDGHLKAVARQLERVRSGAGALLAVEGPAGIGKSRLLRAIGSMASIDGLTVLAARAGELEHAAPFGVVRQLFEAEMSRRSVDDTRSLLSGAAAAANRLFHVFEEPADPFQMLHALYWLLANMSRGAPALVLIDDAHWADDPSLRFVRYLLPRLEELPVLVILAVRSTHGGELSVPLAEIFANEACIVEALNPLTVTGTATILAAAFNCDPEDTFVLACHRVSGGNPFLLQELVRALTDRAVTPISANIARIETLNPPAVARAVTARLVRLPQPARALARALAVLESGRLRTVSGLADLTVDKAALAASMLADAGIVDPGEDLRFMHPLVRSALYAEIPAWERALLHRRAADLLAGNGAAAEEVGTQLLLTETDGEPRTVHLLTRAAAASSARGAPDIAARYLSRALAEPMSAEDRADALFRLGVARTSAGDGGGIDVLIESARATGDPSTRATRSLAAADLLILAGRWQEAVALLEQAADLEGLSTELRYAVRVRQVCCGRFDATTCRTYGHALREMLGCAAGDGPPVRELQVYAALDALQWSGFGGAAALLDHALAPPGLLSFHDGTSTVTGCAMATLAYLDRFDEFDTLLDHVLSDLRGREAHRAYISMSVFRAIADVRRGRLRDIESYVSLGGKEVLAEPDGFYGPALQAPLISAFVQRGELDQAERVLGAHPIAEQQADLVTALVRLARGRLRLAQGRATDALGDITTAGEHLGAAEIHSPAMEPWRSLAVQSHLLLGQRAEAIRFATEELELARRLGGPTQEGIALRSLGLARGGPQGLELLRQSVGLLLNRPARLELARSQVELGAAMRRANRRADAREPLRRGLDLAVRLGASPLADRAHIELAATGVRVRRPVLTGVEALTASERRVAELAAAGMANRDIAQTLFITTKTVEKHLGCAYAKLGISGRGQVSKALAAKQ